MTDLNTITRTHELPFGAFVMQPVADETDALYYANGKTAYLYTSQIDGSMYLLTPLQPVTAETRALFCDTCKKWTTHKRITSRNAWTVYSCPECGTEIQHIITAGTK